MTEKQNHIVSFLALIKKQYVQKPPWHRFWEKPKTFIKDEWQRFSVAITEKEAKALLKCQDGMMSEPIWTLLFASLSGVREIIYIKNVQLERLQEKKQGLVENYITHEPIK